MRHIYLVSCIFNKKNQTESVAMSEFFCNFAADLRVMCTHTRITQHNV